MIRCTFPLIEMIANTKLRNLQLACPFHSEFHCPKGILGQGVGKHLETEIQLSNDKRHVS